MQAKIKCSNCGSEITNLSLSYGKKQWSYMLVAFIPMIVVYTMIWRPDPDYRRDLKASLITVHYGNKGAEVLGKVTNSGGGEWQFINVKAEFFDKSGKLVNLSSSSLPGSLKAHSEDNFKIPLYDISSAPLDPDFKVEVTVAGASYKKF
jgi:hypothetical protein